MMEAAPAAALVVAEADLLLELLVIALDQPARLGGMDQVLEWGARRQVGQPVLGWLLSARGPLDQQPLLRPGLRALGVAVRRTHPQGSEAGGELGLAAVPPSDPAPGPLGQAEGQVFDGNRLMPMPAADPRRWSAPAGPEGGRQRLPRRRPDAGAAADAAKGAELESRYPDPDVEPSTIPGGNQ